MESWSHQRWRPRLTKRKFIKASFTAWISTSRKRIAKKIFNCYTQRMPERAMMLLKYLLHHRSRKLILINRRIHLENQKILRLPLIRSLPQHFWWSLFETGRIWDSLKYLPKSSGSTKSAVFIWFHPSLLHNDPRQVFFLKRFHMSII